MPDRTKELYQQAVARPEYKEMVNYLTMRGITPQGRKLDKISEVNDVDDLVYELTHVVQQEMGRQVQQQPGGQLARMDAGMQTKPGSGASGATDFRVMLDLAIREQQAQQPKPRGML